MEPAEIAVGAVAAAVALYSLIHLVWAASSDTYSGLFGASETGGSRFLFYAHLVLLLIGCGLLCISAVDVLFRWMPYDWGTDVEGEYQSYRERFSQLLGVVLGLCSLGFLASSHDRHELAEKERAAVEASARKSAADEARHKEWASAVENRGRQNRAEQVEKTMAAHRFREAQEAALRLGRLKAMTEDELDILWLHRPLISWTEPMRGMSDEEQRRHWATHLLHETTWDIPKDLERAVDNRLSKSTV